MRVKRGQVRAPAAPATAAALEVGEFVDRGLLVPVGEDPSIYCGGEGESGGGECGVECRVWCRILDVLHVFLRLFEFLLWPWGFVLALSSSAGGGRGRGGPFGLCMRCRTQMVAGVPLIAAVPGDAGDRFGVGAPDGPKGGRGEGVG